MRGVHSQTEYGFLRHPNLAVLWLTVIIASMLLGCWLAVYSCILLGFAMGTVRLIASE